MKTTKAKEKLTEALRNLPGDFALSTTRQHMVNALKSIQKFEERYSEKKQTNLDLHNQWWGEIVSNTVNQPTAPHSAESVMRTLSYIDLLIDKEKKTIESIQIEREKKANGQVFLS